MKKTLLMASALLALTVGTATAQGGINLSWFDCGDFGSQNAVFACNSNTGSNQLVGSFIPPVGITAMSANVGIVDLQSGSTVMSDWWRFDACRSTALSLDSNFLTSYQCADHWQNLASNDFQVLYPRTSASTERITLSVALPDNSPAIGPMDYQAEYYSFRLIIDHQKTVGTDACAGCLYAVCIVLNELDLDQSPPLASYRVINPANRNYVAWEGGAIGGFGCPAATATRNTTWGSVKALYR